MGICPAQETSNKAHQDMHVLNLFLSLGQRGWKYLYSMHDTWFAPLTAFSPCLTAYLQGSRLQQTPTPSLLVCMTLGQVNKERMPRESRWRQHLPSTVEGPGEWAGSWAKWTVQTFLVAQANQIMEERKEVIVGAMN